MHEVKKVREAREIMQELRYPSVKDVIKMMAKGLLLNMPIPHDILRAEKTYGPDVATVKKKLNSHERVSVPRNLLKHQMMYSDIFYWRGLCFMLSIVQPLRLKFVTAITKRETKPI